MATTKTIAQTQQVAAFGFSVVSDGNAGVTLSYTKSGVTIAPLGTAQTGTVHLTIPTPTNMSPDLNMTQITVTFTATSSAKVDALYIYFNGTEKFTKASLGQTATFTENVTSTGYTIGAAVGVTLDLALPASGSNVQLSGVTLNFT